MPEDKPITCCLTDVEFREREALLLARFKAAVSETTELPDGFAFHAPGDKTWISLLAELMVAERECCPFMRFELTAEPNMGPVTMSVTGPPGAKAFLKKLLSTGEGSCQASSGVANGRLSKAVVDSPP